MISRPDRKRRDWRRRLAEIESFYAAAEQKADEEELERATTNGMSVEEWRNSQMASAKLRLLTYRPPDPAPSSKE
jgi:hypothetical protein